MTKTYYTVEHNYFSAGINEEESCAFETELSAMEWALDRQRRLGGSVYINGVHCTTKDLLHAITAIPARKEA